MPAGCITILEGNDLLTRPTAASGAKKSADRDKWSCRYRGGSTKGRSLDFVGADGNAEMFLLLELHC